LQDSITDSRLKYAATIEELSNPGGPSIEKKLELMFEKTNLYRNEISKVSNHCEDILRTEFKEGPYSKNKEIKKAIYVDFIEQKKL